MKYLARPGQLLTDHLKNVGDECDKNTQLVYPGSFLGQTIGSLHDIGKGSSVWQKYLQDSINGIHYRLGHAIHGALYLFSQSNTTNSRAMSLASLCIAGHHRGLYDVTDFRNSYKEHLQELHNIDKIFKKLPQGFNVSSDEEKRLSDLLYFDFRLRYEFSSVIDADRNDAARNSGFIISRVKQSTISDLNQKVDKWLENNFAKTSDTNLNPLNVKLNKERNDFREDILKKVNTNEKFLSLSGPTAIGKTVSLLKFALAHGVAKNKERIIILVPRVSIIEQSAEIYKSILGKNNVCIHHSNVEYETDNHSFTEAWNAPVILTTDVRFFETLFSHKPKDLRRYKNIRNSVVIYDEGHLFPTNLLTPTLEILKRLAEKDCLDFTFILSTATYPFWDDKKNLPEHIPHIEELVSNPKRLFSEMANRVNISYCDEELNNETLFNKIKNKEDLAVIFTYKKIASSFYRFVREKVKEQHSEHELFFLSAAQCIAHRKKIEKRIKELKKQGKPVILIASSVVDTGIDLSFQTVYRQITGIPSLIQSSGRCNRSYENGEYGGEFVIFEWVKEDIKDKRTLFWDAETSRRILNMFPNNLEKIFDYKSKLCDRFFKGKYSNPEKTNQKVDSTAINKNGVKGKPDTTFSDLRRGGRFETMSREYNLINDDNTSVFVPYGDCDKILKELEKLMISQTGSKKTPQVLSKLKKLQEYTVSIYNNEKGKLLKSDNILEEVECLSSDNNKVYKLAKDKYDRDVGMTTD